MLLFHLTPSITEGDVLEQCSICEDSCVCTLNMCYPKVKGGKKTLSFFGISQ